MPDLQQNRLPFYRRLWTRLVNEPFTPDSLMASLRRDGGVDFEGLSDEDLRAVIEGRPPVAWNELAFAFSEALACYSVAGGIATPQQAVGWAVAAVTMADAVRAQAADWELVFDNLIKGCIGARMYLDADEALEVLGQVIAPPTGSASSQDRSANLIGPTSDSHPSPP